jgi:hypothetical protein
MSRRIPLPTPMAPKGIAFFKKVIYIDTWAPNFVCGWTVYEMSDQHCIGIATDTSLETLYMELALSTKFL